MSKELEEIGVLKDSDSKVKISTAEYRDLVEAVATLKGMVEHEKEERWAVRVSLMKCEDEVELYKEFVSSDEDLMGRFSAFRTRKELEKKQNENK